mgnify:CR=1 FL=1
MSGAVAAMRRLPNIVLPFPGGAVRSGSKIGSRYKALIASTNDAFCPTIRGQTARHKVVRIYGVAAAAGGTAVCDDLLDLRFFIRRRA